MARPTKLTPEVAQIIYKHIAECATYEAACEAAGIGYSTFRSWLLRGEDDKAWVDAHPNALVLPEELMFLEFLEGVTRAHAESLTSAAKAYHSGIIGGQSHEYMREQVTEPLRDKKGDLVLDKDNNPKMVTKTIEREVVRQDKADWRAAESFLKRRDTENWSDKLVIEATLKQLPSDAVYLLPQLAETAQSAGVDLVDIFNHLIREFANAEAS